MTEMMVARVSKMVSRLRAAMMPSTRPTMAPSVTAMPPTRMEMGRRDWISWEMGVFLEIL